MSELGPRDVAPMWVWWATALSAVLAVGVQVVGGAAYGTVGLAFAALTVVGVTVLLYGWGQVRSEYEDDEESGGGESTDRRERELEAEAGGYGGSGGGA